MSRSSTFGERAKLGPSASKACSCSDRSTWIVVIRSSAGSSMGLRSTCSDVDEERAAVGVRSQCCSENHSKRSLSGYHNSIANVLQQLLFLRPHFKYVNTIGESHREF